MTVDDKSPDRQLWTYHKKTFDTENQNRTDDTTTVVLERDASGKFVGKDVIYG